MRASAVADWTSEYSGVPSAHELPARPHATASDARLPGPCHDATLIDLVAEGMRPTGTQQEQRAGSLSTRGLVLGPSERCGITKPSALERTSNSYCDHHLQRHGNHERDSRSNDI